MEEINCLKEANWSLQIFTLIRIHDMRDKIVFIGYNVIFFFNVKYKYNGVNGCRELTNEF